MRSLIARSPLTWGKDLCLSPSGGRADGEVQQGRISLSWDSVRTRTRGVPADSELRASVAGTGSLESVGPCQAGRRRRSSYAQETDREGNTHQAPSELETLFNEWKAKPGDIPWEQGIMSWRVPS